MLSDDHAERRRLARAAADERWSVRELENRARSAGAVARAGRKPKRRARVIHPDQQAAIEQISDALGEALGFEVAVSAAGGEGYRAQLEFASLEDALTLARRLRGRATAR